MYLKITSRCNMSCPHCGMNCTAKGEDMTPRVYKKAIEFATDTESITLGGGEPTLHKDFWGILGLSIGSVENVWLATNGSQTETSLKLANMARRGVIGCALSLDCYHDPIDPRVIQAFTRNKSNYGFNYGGGSENDYREIRDVTGREIIAGRCEEGEEGCVCEGLMIEPNGDIKACGCDDAPTLGTIFKPCIPEDWETYTCHKKQEQNN